MDHDQPLHWLKNIAHPTSKSTCAYQGFKCPTDEQCDCEQFCSNEKDFIPYRIPDKMKGSIYVMNKKLTPGSYCLPKGVENCNLKTSYPIFSRAGWSCITINDDIFENHKIKACKNEEAIDNDLNVLYDYLEHKNVDHGIIDNYYEKLPQQNIMRYRCKCDSLSLDHTPMISVFPFICSVDYCLRDIDIHKLVVGMGWDFQKEECHCGPYPHLNPNDKTSPCRMHASKIDGNELTGRVDCMTSASFVKYPLICPPGHEKIIFKKTVFQGNNPVELIDTLV